MKTFKVVATIFLVILLVSCEESEDTVIDVNAQQSDLIGTWNLTQVTQDGTGTVTIENIPISGKVNAFGKDINAQIIVAENPNTVNASGGYTAEITASLATGSRTEDVPVTLSEVLSGSSWSLNEGVLKLANGEEQLEVNITELTTNSLKIEFDYDDKIVVPGFLDGQPITLDTKVNMSFTKQ